MSNSAEMAEGVEGEIARLIQERGRITFAQFMETALFSPHGGYYASTGHQDERDFFTAPAAHPAFGALVALHLEQLWQLMGMPSPFHVIEIGAGRGILARDIVDYSSNLTTGFSDALRYLAVDYHPPRDLPNNAQAIKAQNLPFRDVVGCVLSNELLDALPVHRFAVQDGRIKEVYVTLKEGALGEELGEPSTPRLEQRLAGLGLELSEGFRGDVNLAMDEWITEASSVLTRGLLLTFDYGHLAQDMYSPARSRGTLRCYYRHVLSGNPYQRVGRQDITAHVDFTSLMRAGEEHDLTTVGFTTQRDFFGSLGLSRFLDSLAPMHLSQRERNANRMGMLELVKAGEMGDFKVLAQAKELSQDVRLHGFLPIAAHEDPWAGRNLPTPLLSSEHMDLAAGRYPQTSVDWEELWPFGKEK